MIHNHTSRGRGGPARRSLLPPVLAAVLLVAVSPLPAKDLSQVPGFVDGGTFLDALGEDSLTLEVRLSGTLLKPLCGLDEELCELVSGIEMIHAMIFDMTKVGESGKHQRAISMIDDIERGLLRRGWERLALVRDQDATVRVLLLISDEIIEGLVVMITDEEELVFTNIAGVIDLAKLQELAEKMDLPGLEDVDLEEMQEGKDDD